jgi:hypothetical protein
VIFARGPQAAERVLLDEIDRLRPRRVEELGAPLRIVVPSSSLRVHLLRRVALEYGSLVGVAVQTLHGVATELIERAIEPGRVGDAAFELMVRRYASRQPELRGELDGLQDGYGVVAAAVRDLLDAGFFPVHADAVRDKLEDLRGRVADRRLARVAALVRVASLVSDELSRLGVRRSAQAPQRASELLAEDGPRLLPARAVLVHGFADATGVATDFIHALLIGFGGLLVLDRPPDPALPGEDDGGAVFLDRFSSHFSGMAIEESSESVTATELEAFSASTAEAEVRELANRIRSLLDRDAVPESIAVVAREIEPIAAPLRRHFSRLGIPFSGVGAELPGGGLWRRARLLSQSLRQGSESPVELWLACLVDLDSSTAPILALRSLGVARLDELARTELHPDAEIPLPLPPGDPDGEEASEPSLAGSVVMELAARARESMAVLSNWPESATASDHLFAARRLTGSLGLDADDGAAQAVGDELQRLCDELPVDWPVSRQEFQELAGQRLDSVGSEPIGGAGGGVQLLSAMEARARSFEQLFVVGLNRGHFPRVVEEDALLPDSVRGHLAAEVLPEFPIKARGLDEERYLFAQLLSSAPRVTMSWRNWEDGKRLAPSPLVERLRREISLEGDAVPGALDLQRGADDPYRPRPAFEHALVAADPRRRAAAGPVLAEAVTEGRLRAGLDEVGAAEWASIRLDVLESVDPSRPVRGPGPWAGLIGPVTGTSLKSVTGLEQVARCPWRTFATRRLGIWPMPDPRHGLPDAGGAVIGDCVHSVLQTIVDHALDRGRLELDDVLELEPGAVPWPDPPELEELIRRAARAVARRNGLAGVGMAPLIAARTRTVLEVVRELDWEGGVLPGVLAAEVSGELVVDEGGTPLRFRADRVDRTEAGVVLSDYKTGRPPWKVKTAKYLRKHLVSDVRTGRALQAAAYALAAAAEGRYLYLAPELGDRPEEARDTRVAVNDEDLIAGFRSSVKTLGRVWHDGALPPRVADEKGREPGHCSHCPVRQGCLRDDSGYRRRLVEWMRLEGAAETELEARARELWWLGVDRAEGDG